MSLALLLPAALAALAALLLPLLLHLARRSEQKPTDFAALRWLRHKPRPRHRIRFDEWPLLLLRLLLLALLALWLARPVLSGVEDDAPRVAVVPGADPAQARAGADARARLHWLAPGFPSLDEPAPAGSLPVGSLLRQLDAELPRAAPLTVVAPSQLQGADAQRPALSRAVEWKVVDGAMPAPPAEAPKPLSLAVRHAQGDDAGLRYLRAAAAAWTPEGAAPALDVGAAGQPIPATARQLIWLAPGALPGDVRAWIERGGTALVGARTTVPSLPGATPAWRDDAGETLVEAAALGRGRVLRLARELEPAAMPALLEADFPQRLRALFDAAPAAPARAYADAYAPMTGAAAYPAAPSDLQPWLALLVATLALVERWLATRRTRSASP